MKLLEGKELARTGGMTGVSQIQHPHPSQRREGMRHPAPKNFLADRGSATRPPESSPKTQDVPPAPSSPKSSRPGAASLGSCHIRFRHSDSLTLYSVGVGANPYLSQVVETIGPEFERHCGIPGKSCSSRFARHSRGDSEESAAGSYRWANPRDGSSRTS